MPLSPKIKFVRLIVSLSCLLFVFASLNYGQTQNKEEEDLGSRSICPEKVFRKYGSCDPNAGTSYKRVITRSNSSESGNEKIRKLKRYAVKRKYGIKTTPLPNPNTDGQTNSGQIAKISKKELSPLTSQKVGITIWKLSDKVSESSGERGNLFEKYPPVRMSSDPTLAYGDKVRIGIESPQDGYLYVINRELYDDGTMSAGQLIFPSSQMQANSNRVVKNRPVEIPNISDDTFYFESEPNSPSGKKVLGEILSVIITKNKIVYLENLAKKKAESSGDSTEDLYVISKTKIAELENLYSGRCEIFEFENTLGKSSAQLKNEVAALSGNRVIGQNEAVPQTLYLVENKRKGGVLVTLALKYESGDKALFVGMDDYMFASPTPGGVNDAIEMANLVQNKFGFTEDSVKILTNKQATAANIRKQFREWLIEGTKPGDRVFFFFAGHGSQVPDDDGEEKEDKRDEVLAGYDITMKLDQSNLAVPTDNFIRDDEVEQWIAELAGRRVIFVIDSCHAGTISRSGSDDNSWQESRFLRAKTGLKLSNQAVVSPGAKDTIVKQDKVLKDLVSNAVIITGSKSDQEAMPIRIQNKVHGAFTYSFIETLNNVDTISVSDLEEQLKEFLKKLRKEGSLKPGRNGEFQEPGVEVFSKDKKELEKQPLFGNSWTSAPKTAFVNPLSATKVSLRFKEEKTIYRKGETYSLTIETNKAGYLYLLVFSQDNKATCMFPNPAYKDVSNYIEAGKHSFPRANSSFIVKEPFGQDVWVAIVSDQKIGLGEKEDYSWNDVFSRIGLEDLQKAIGEKARMRGAGVTVSTINEWQAATVTLQTVEK